MASTSRAPAAQTVVLPDDIWEDIFLRLDAAADLARASAACSSFHTIISARPFLRRFRSLHSPPFLGCINTDRGPRFVPVEPPHRSAPEARALQQAADLTFSFFPDPSSWRVRHARDGRVLLGQRVSKKPQFEDFLVCDPLYRRYVKIPRMPDDLIASAIPTGNGTAAHLSPVLAPAGEDDEEGSFRVICAVLLEDKAVAIVFSSCNQTWQGVISMISSPSGLIEYTPYYVHGCLYGLFCFKGYSLMLDTSDMEFSIIELPPHDFHSNRAIVEAEEGRLRLITIADHTSDLHCKNWQSNGNGAQELQHDKLIPLPDSEINSNWRIEGIAGRYLALSACNEIYDESSINSEHFVLDIKTLLVEKLCSSNNDLFYGGFPYARFPPPLALPSI